MIKTIYTKEEKGTMSFIDYTPNTESEQLGLKVFTKHIQLTKNLSELNEEKEFLEEVNKYVKFSEILKFSENSKKNLAVLLMAGNIIMQKGRRGPAHNVLIGRNKFEELFEQEERDSLQRFYKVWFSKDENLDYVLVWRVGADDEPGCILVKNDEKYAFVSTGFYPEAQFVKIKIE